MRVGRIFILVLPFLSFYINAFLLEIFNKFVRFQENEEIKEIKPN